MNTSTEKPPPDEPLASWLALLDYLMAMSDGANAPGRERDYALLLQIMGLAAGRIDEISGAVDRPLPEGLECGPPSVLRPN